MNISASLDCSSALLSRPAGVLPASAELQREIAQPGAGAPPATVAPGADRSLPPILVAEDDADDLFFIQRLIKKTGAKNPVQTFNDGTEVVNFMSGRARLAAASGVRRPAPLLLFLDLNMAGLDGFGFLDWARQQRNLVPLTTVILSNSNEPDDMARALALGAHRYLVKYPSLQTFTTIVKSVHPQTVFSV